MSLVTLLPFPFKCVLESVVGRTSKSGGEEGDFTMVEVGFRACGDDDDDVAAAAVGVGQSLLSRVVDDVSGGSA